MKCANKNCRSYLLEKNEKVDADFLRKVSAGLQCQNCGRFKEVWITKLTARKYGLESSKYVHIVG